MWHTTNEINQILYYCCDKQFSVRENKLLIDCSRRCKQANDKKSCVFVYKLISSTKLYVLHQICLIKRGKEGEGERASERLNNFIL